MTFIRNQFPGYALLILLFAVLLYRGIIPALTRVDSDFPNYYTAARIVVSGGDVSRLYDDAWFRDQIHSFGMSLDGKFSPFPPITSLVFLPLSLFDPLTALRIMTAINLVFLLATIIVLARVTQISIIESAIFILLSGVGLANCFRLGQLYIVLSFLMVFGYYLHLQKKPALAGICFGLLLPVKYFPIIFLGYFVLKKEWRIAMYGIATAMLVASIGIAVLGMDIHREYISSVLGNHLASHFSGQDPFSPTFQSWDSLLHRLFVFDETLNPTPLFVANNLFPVLKWIVLLLLFILGCAGMGRIHRNPSQNPGALSLGLLSVVTFLLSPGTATYHYVLFWLPIGLLTSEFFRQQRKAEAYTILGTYSVLGYIPYGLTRQFDGAAILTLLAYPRLGILVAMFITILYCSWNNRATSNTLR